MNPVIDFMFTFIFVYFGYYFFIIRRQKNYNARTCPGEALFLIRAYKIKIDCVKYNHLLQIMALTNAFIIGLTVALVSFIHGMLIKFIVGFFILILLIIIFYSMIGFYYKKRGMTKDV